MPPLSSRQDQDREASESATARTASSPLFRDEALRHHYGQREYGRLLEPPPRWTRWAYPLIVVLFLGALALLFLGRTRESARGPAVVRAESRAEGGTSYAVVAFLPEALRPYLHVGMPLRVELSDRPGASLWLRIDQLADAIDTAEARRALGIGDGLPVPDRAVLVRASLPATTPSISLEESLYRDGMIGVAEVSVRSERWIAALLPSLSGRAARGAERR